MAQIDRIGFGQVEPNHLSAQRTGQIYAQLPAATAITTLENGQFAKYDYATGEVNYTGAGEWMLVFNEVKLYGSKETYKDFALQKTDYIDGVMTPRLFKINIGDIFTTNTVKKAATSKDGSTTGEDLAVKDTLVVNAAGYLEKSESPAAGAMVWEVAKITTMPDGQAAIKVVRIK